MTELPQAFLHRMEQMLGEEEFRLFLSSYDRAPVKALRVNTLRISVEDFLQISPFALRPVPWCREGFCYPEERAEEGALSSAESDWSTRPGRHVYHEMGLYYIQEPSAMAVAALSGTQPGERILDLCAAPGGKSTQLAAMLGGTGLLVSNEISPERARILSQNMERMGIRNAVVTNETPEHLAQRFGAFFDRVVVDAPCSGEGMFRKDAEAAAQWSEENVRHCAARQQEILEQAVKMVRPGGILVYSTCTFAPAEDEESIALFMCRHPEYHVMNLPNILGAGTMQRCGFETGRPRWCRESIPAEGTKEQIPEAIRNSLAGTIRLFPHRLEGEGHFVAVLRREGGNGTTAAGFLSEEQSGRADPRRPDPEMTGRTDAGPDRTESARVGAERRDAGWENNEQENGRQGSRHREKRNRKGDAGSRVSGAGESDLAAFLSQTMAGENLPWQGVPVRFGDELYLEQRQIPLEGLRVLRPGLDLGAFRKNRFEPAHALALALRPSDVKRCYELNVPDDQAGHNRAIAWLRGESIPCPPSLAGWTLVTVNGCSIGWGKAAGGMLKNHYPKGLRKNY